MPIIKDKNIGKTLIYSKKQQLKNLTGSKVRNKSI